MIKVFILVLVLSFMSSAQNLITVYQGKAKPKFEKIWQIGGDTENINNEIGSPLPLKVDSQGNVYVLNNKESVIKKFSPEGKFIKSFGRKGKGPGEFLDASGFEISFEDVLYVYDSSQQLFCTYDTEGKFLKNVKTERSSTPFVLTESGMVNCGYKNRREKEKIIITQKIECLDKKFTKQSIVDSLSFHKFSFKNLEGRQVVFPVKYYPSLHLQFIDKDSYAVLNSSNFCFKLYKSGSLVKEKIISEDKPYKVSEKDKERYLSRWDYDKEYKKSIKNIVEISRVKPYFSYVLKDNNGCFLLRNNKNETEGIFDIISFDGDLINKIKLPDNIFTVNSIIDEDHIYTIEKDENDFQYLTKYKIIF